MESRSRRTLACALLTLIASFAFASGKPAVLKADRIVIVKSARTMTLLRSGKTLKTYKVALGEHPVGAKMREGDGKTPEGQYTISEKNQHSQFHLSLKISYPSAADRAHARAAGVDPGGDIFIHGLPPQWAWLGAAQRTKDWTEGCVAVTNAEIEEIWSMVDVGTPVEIRP
ncbi:MAG TPA: L,D-transpeptidase family protein [Candidatus Angelobacter sp.]|nr:L,D-transpeptidase family protein [Candidatus Angelobacter sp.]